MSERRTARRLLVIAVFLGTAACGKIPGFKPPPPPPPPAVPSIQPLPPPAAAESKPTPPVTLTVQASASINLSATNRPSSVVVRIYLLKADARFRSAAYDKLYEDDKAVLEGDRVDHWSFTLSPGEQKPLQLQFSGETRFVAIAAFFREGENSTRWKDIVSAPFKGDRIVTIDKSSVSFAAK